MCLLIYAHESHLLFYMYLPSSVSYIRTHTDTLMHTHSGRGRIVFPSTYRSVALKSIWHNVRCLHFLPASLGEGPPSCFDLKMESCPFKQPSQSEKGGSGKRRGDTMGREEEEEEEGGGLCVQVFIHGFLRVCVLGVVAAAVLVVVGHPGRPQIN